MSCLIFYFSRLKNDDQGFVEALRITFFACMHDEIFLAFI